MVRAGRSGARTSVGGEIFRNHVAFCIVGNGALSRGVKEQGCDVDYQPHLVSGLKKG